MRKFLALLMSIVMTLSLLVSSVWAEDPPTTQDLVGKTVILHTNDVHGAIDKYEKVAVLKADYEARGAKVILADAGDYSQGSVYVSVHKGADAVTMMNKVGYNVATIGNHEFDYGYEQLAKNMEKADFKVLCANVLKADKTIFDANMIMDVDGVKIGFFGLETPEAQTKANPALIQGLKFVGGEEMYKLAQAQVNELKTQGAEIVICLAHLGVDAGSEPNTSYDLAKKVTGIDLIIDGHSHTRMLPGTDKIQTGVDKTSKQPIYDVNPDPKLPIQSTGTALATVGVAVIDNATKKIVENSLVDLSKVEGKNDAVAAAAKAIMDPIDADYGQVFANTKVELNGDRAPGNRTMETNMGDLITDAMLWAIKTKAPDVNMANAVAITNGGGIRAAIKAGDITKKDVNTVLPFGNTLAVVYVTGAELLEALEASTFCTPEEVGGFPQFAGMKVELNIAPKYDANAETYPDSTYHGPKTINRITIKEVNGKAFDKNATYAVITNNFLAAGGDTYYAFAAAKSQFDTGLPLDEILMEYITTELERVVGEQYAKPQGRLVIVNNPKTADAGVAIYVGLAIMALTGGVFVARKKELF